MKTIPKSTRCSAKRQAPAAVRNAKRPPRTTKKLPQGDAMRSIDIAMSSQTPNRQTVAVGVLAQLCNLTPARCSQLANEGVMHKAEHGLYYLVASVNGYIRYLQERTIGNKEADYAGAKHPSKDSPVVRLAEAKARIAEAEAARLEGSQLPVESFARAWAEILTIIRTKLLSIETSVPPAARKATRAAVHEALTELADHDTDAIAEKIIADITGDSPSPSKPDRQ